jgi:hypothetical protein
MLQPRLEIIKCGAFVSVLFPVCDESHSHRSDQDMPSVLQDLLLHRAIAPLVILAPLSITSDPRQPISCPNPKAPDCPHEVCLSSFPLKKEVASGS